MTLKDIYEPIGSEIEGVKRELNQLLQTFGFDSTTEIMVHFSKMPGKFLRPALVLLAAKTIQPQPNPEVTDLLIRAGAGVELIHDASLVHDDILDNDTQRRGQATINGLWGNKVALLAGDVLYSRAFGILTTTLSTELLQRVVRLNETMCSAEIEQARTLGRDLKRNEYVRIIEGKTAAFMSLCCRLGASLAGAGVAETELLSAFGLNFGLAFQMFDDRADGDLACPEVDTSREGRQHAEKAIASLVGLKPTPARDQLVNMARHLIEANC